MKARFTAGPILTFTCSDWLSSQNIPTQLTLADINREWGSQDVRLTTLLHLVLRLRMHRAITPILIHLLEIVLTYAQGQLELVPLKAQFFW